MKNFAILILATIVIFIIWGLFSNKQNNPKNTISINNKTFILDIAKSNQEQEVGLAKYNKLPSNMGMLFPFSNYDYFAFWMKDMKFPIDIIYIKDSTIVDIFENVPNPKSPDEKLTIYKPRTKANFVFEINAGLSHTYNFKIGDKVKINL